MGIQTKLRRDQGCRQQSLHKAWQADPHVHDKGLEPSTAAKKQRRHYKNKEGTRDGTNDA
ncbi:hypothetical protein PsorP6_013577 [Peronosclerospora sorghi]|uniref:Uncharacterized protein n=1 Tax=Peronosclerospora sorghi TaxID=230839 RepID=A0ACC0VHD2_9STRA|nr:hypothetical protein PsorP6_013577 [Peronosclerospora sorghi]